jgi:hypothetical protein
VNDGPTQNTFGIALRENAAFFELDFHAMLLQGFLFVGDGVGASRAGMAYDCADERERGECAVSAWRGNSHV